MAGWVEIPTASNVLTLDNTTAFTPDADYEPATKKYVDDLIGTEEEVEDIVGGMLTGNTETFIEVTYQDADGTIDFVVPVKDEDNMASDSDTYLATQQSIKAYADTKVALSLFDAHTILAATADNTPAALSVTEQTLVGRLTGGNIAAIAIGLANDNIPQIDDADGIAANDYIKATAAGFVGRTYTEVKADLDLEIGTDIPALAHTSQHAVGGSDTIFPADPGADRFLMWDDDPGVLVWAAGAAVSSFNDLDDVPAAYAGESGKYVRVKATEDGLEFATPAGGITDLVQDLTPQLGGDLDLNGHNIDFPTTANISDCLDEDNMASDSDTKICTQQSIKAYVDNSVAGAADETLDWLGV